MFEVLFDPKELLDKAIKLFKEHKSREKRNSILEDKGLIGYIDLIEKILEKKPEFRESSALEKGLLNEVFFKCLFPDDVKLAEMDVTSTFDVNSSTLFFINLKPI